jgi:ferritin-like metal-binding protein YciE
MVDESLKQHFETHTDLTKSQIDALFDLVSKFGSSMMP